jgi:hypothetical protein
MQNEIGLGHGIHVAFSFTMFKKPPVAGTKGRSALLQAMRFAARMAIDLGLLNDCPPWTPASAVGLFLATLRSPQSHGQFGFRNHPCKICITLQLE